MRRKTYSNPESNWLTKSETASAFNISPSSVDSLAIQARAKVKVGRSARYDAKRIEEFLRTECLAER